MFYVNMKIYTNLIWYKTSNVINQFVKPNQFSNIWFDLQKQFNPETNKQMKKRVLIKDTNHFILT